MENDEEDSEFLPDSLDINEVPDSGIGSSSERTSSYKVNQCLITPCFPFNTIPLQPNQNNTKVGVEIEKFQKVIEKATVEKAKSVDWKKKKTYRSTDSLLSMDEGSDSTRSSTSSPPALPPKNRFLSTDNLSPSPPPALPPKKPSSNLNKRLSISTVCINSSESDCLTDGSVAERIKSFMNKASSGSTTEMHLSARQPLVKIRPRRSMMDLSLENEDSSTTEEKPKAKIEDLPKELPSVRNLASMFTKKSPEPLPRKSITKVSNTKLGASK